MLSKEYDLFTPERKEVNFLNDKSIIKYLTISNPDIIINCAAYTNVEKADSDKNICNRVNHEAIRVLSKFSEKNNVKLIQISTDYVFGNKENKIPWKEYEHAEPLNYYGKSKLAAEIFLASRDLDYLIIRTSGIYSKGKQNNFLNTMMNLFNTKKIIEVVKDQFSCPTPAWWLARVISKIVLKKLENKFDKKIKILHATASGEVSWYEFAEQILYELRILGKIKYNVNLKKISSYDYDSKVTRPKYSRLDNSLLNSMGIESINWRLALKKTILEIEKLNDQGK